MTATITPVLSFPAAASSDARSLGRDIRGAQTCAMDQTRFVWVIPNVGQDLMDRIRPLLHDLRVESEESLSTTCVRVSLRLERVWAIPPEDPRGTFEPSSRD